MAWHICLPTPRRRSTYVSPPTPLGVLEQQLIDYKSCPLCFCHMHRFPLQGPRVLPYSTMSPRVWVHSLRTAWRSAADCRRTGMRMLTFWLPEGCCHFQVSTVLVLFSCARTSRLSVALSNLRQNLSAVLPCRRSRILFHTREHVRYGSQGLPPPDNLVLLCPFRTTQKSAEHHDCVTYFPAVPHLSFPPLKQLRDDVLEMIGQGDVAPGRSEVSRCGPRLKGLIALPCP